MQQLNNCHKHKARLQAICKVIPSYKLLSLPPSLFLSLMHTRARAARVSICFRFISSQSFCISIFFLIENVRLLIFYKNLEVGKPLLVNQRTNQAFTFAINSFPHDCKFTGDTFIYVSHINTELLVT